jgi:hypothetical protein
MGLPAGVTAMSARDHHQAGYPAKSLLMLTLRAMDQMRDHTAFFADIGANPFSATLHGLQIE